MNAREFFCAARDAVQRQSTYRSRLEAKRQLAVMKARREGPSGRGGVTDPTKRIDDLIELQREFERERESDRALIGRATRVLKGYSGIDALGATVLAMRYLGLVRWPEIADRMGIGYRRARELEGMALDRIDSEGLAAIERGRLGITGAER